MKRLRTRPWGTRRLGGGFEEGEDFGRGIRDTVGGRRRNVRLRRILLPVGSAAGADGGFFLFVAAAPEFGEELFGEAGVAGSEIVCDEFVAGREGAEAFVDDDLFYCLRGFCGQGGRACLGKVGGGDLEAVEKQAGAAWVDLVAGDAAEDVDDGELETGAVVAVGEVEVEGGLAAAARASVRGGLARGVVVVAELFAAERGRAAAASVGVDVAALEAFRL